MSDCQESLGELLERVEAVVFDFDGTLVDSNDIKWHAFEQVFSMFPDHLPEIMAYCRSANHTVRGDKFRYVHERIVGVSFTPEIDRDLHRQFDQLTTAAIVDAKEIPGAAKCLEHLHAGKTLGLLSSTPHAVLVEILNRRQWRRYFDVIQGAPVDKSEWLRDFRDARRLESDAVVFFGDTPEDVAAAARAGWSFVGVGPTGIRGETLHIVDFASLAQ